MQRLVIIFTLAVAVLAAQMEHKHTKGAKCPMCDAKAGKKKCKSEDGCCQKNCAKKDTTAEEKKDEKLCFWEICCCFLRVSPTGFR